MLITAQLFNNGNRIGVAVNDDGLCYEIPLESLYNPIVFEDLISSGYKFVDYAGYEFVRDGQRISDLPVKEYTPTEEFYKVNGGTMTESELRAKLTDNYVAAVPFNEPDKYAINTREEFLAYLNAIANGVPDNDFRPVNFMVAPAARFTPEELVLPTVRYYMDVLERRRRYTYHRYLKLKLWFEKILNKKMNAQSVIDAYYSYGIDGLNLAVSHKNEEVTTESPYGLVFTTDTIETDNGGQRALTQSEAATRDVMRGNYVEVLGIANGNFSDVHIANTISVTEDYRRNPVFKSSTYDTGMLAMSHRALKPGEYKAVTLVVPQDHIVRGWTLINGGSQGFVTACDSRFTITTSTVNEYGEEVPHTFTYNNLRVTNPADKYNLVPIYNWDKDYAFFTDYAITMGAAKLLLKKRTKECNTSSYKILLEAGLSPKEACRYIASHNGYLNYPFSDRTKEDKESGAASITKLITNEDLDIFFSTEEVEDINLPTYEDDEFNIPGSERLDLIYNIINGDEDLGAISGGMAHDLDVSSGAIFDALCAAVYILDIPARAVMRKCEEFDGSKEFIEFSNNGMTLRISIPSADRAYNAAVEEKYRLNQLRIKSAHSFYKVDDVATELSTNPAVANRPIAVHGVACAYKEYRFNSANGNAKAEVIEEVDNILHDMEESYIDFFHAQHPTVPLDAVALTASKQARYFFITLFETFGVLPEAYRNAVPEDWMCIHVSHPTWYAILQKYCYRFADSLLSLADAALTFGDGAPEFLTYCTNATIMPDRVVPENGAIIHETPLQAVYSESFVIDHWHDIAHLQARKTYFDIPAKSWYNAPSINRIPSAITINNFGDVTSMTETDIYRDIRTNLLIASNEDDYNRISDNLISKSRRHSILVPSSIGRYYNYGIDLPKWRNEDIIAPPYPLSTVYPREYPDKDFSSMTTTGRRDFSIDGRVARCIVNDDEYEGPSTIAGLEVCHVRNITSLDISTQAVKSLPKLVDGLYGSDICADGELIKLQNDVGKGYFNVVNAVIYDKDNNIVDVHNLSSYSPEEYNIAHVFGRIHYFYTPTGKLYRIEV